MPTERLEERDMEGRLGKSFGVATATSLVVGCVIGAGVFFNDLPR